MNDYFYGWYFRCQGEESIAVIPAVHLGGGKGNCSIQVVTEAGSLYQEFPIDQFRISPDRESMQIGENRFSKKGIRLNLETSVPDQENERRRAPDPTGEVHAADTSETKTWSCTECSG